MNGYLTGIPKASWIVEVYDPDGNGTSKYEARANNRDAAIEMAYIEYCKWALEYAEAFEIDLIKNAYLKTDSRHD
jgi:hypothetical protein